MPVMGGIEVVARLAARGLDTKCVFLSSHRSPILIDEALNAGASG
jgi:DNA-binding NarL/FixJ family response regulator